MLADSTNCHPGIWLILLLNSNFATSGGYAGARCRMHQRIWDMVNATDIFAARRQAHGELER
jgi:hypothetical protein